MFFLGNGLVSSALGEYFEFATCQIDDQSVSQYGAFQMILASCGLAGLSGCLPTELLHGAFSTLLPWLILVV